MNINELKPRANIENNKRLSKTFHLFEKLIDELQKRDLPEKIAVTINNDIEEINSFSEPDNQLKKLIRHKFNAIIKVLEKELKIVPKNYYRNYWSSLGIAAFGIPLGVVFGISLDNMAFIGIGLPIGLAVGSGKGMQMDKKAAEEGRQLDLEISF